MASSISKRRKRKEPMEQHPFDERKFRTLHHALQFGWMADKEIIHELAFQFKENECPKIREKIGRRRWELLVDPVTERVVVDFSPMSIMRILKIRAVPFEEASYQSRMSGDPDHDKIVNDICVLGADWVRDSTGAPKFIRRGDLILEAKGWFEIVRRSILSSSNNSEVNINKAAMVHCIMKGGEIKVYELIAKGIRTMAEKNDSEAWLGYLINHYFMVYLVLN
ncbi:hypothetical protein AHAS_Ahas18G0185200 [Arachis hypogaea]